MSSPLMAAYAQSSPAKEAPHRHGSRAALAGWILLSSLLCGVGLYMVWYLITFFDWIYLLGLPIVGVGAVLLFLKGTGPESAD